MPSNAATMNNPADSFRIIKTNWAVGDERELPAAALEALRGTDAFDSYEQLYRIDGLWWRVEGKISRADGSSLCRLRCVSE